MACMTAAFIVRDAMVTKVTHDFGIDVIGGYGEVSGGEFFGSI